MNKRLLVIGNGSLFHGEEATYIKINGSEKTKCNKGIIGTIF